MTWAMRNEEHISKALLLHIMFTGVYICVRTIDTVVCLFFAVFSQRIKLKREVVNVDFLFQFFLNIFVGSYMNAIEIINSQW